MWENILTFVIDDADYEWLLIDASHIKVHHDEASDRRKLGDEAHKDDIA